MELVLYAKQGQQSETENLAIAWVVYKKVDDMVP